MTFLTVLFALFVERVGQQYRPQREHRWFDSYCKHLSHAGFTQWMMTRPWGAIASLLPPLLLIAWLQALAGDLGGAFEFVFGIVVLIYSLGPRDLGDEADAFITARDADQSVQADAMAQALSPGEAPHTEPQRSLAVARAVVVQASRRLIAPIFWFVLFGPLGAAAYRAIVMLAERLQRSGCPPEMQHHSTVIRGVADWAPARITASGYAIAGNFDAVAHAWRTFLHIPGKDVEDEASQLLAKTGLAALHSIVDHTDEPAVEPGDAFDARLAPPVVEEALALVRRSLALWVMVIAGGSLVAALA